MTMVRSPHATHLRSGRLTVFESLGQSVANIAPTLTPALNIAVVVGLAGTGSWVSYLIATVGLLFIGASITTLARRHPVSGAFFVFVGRTFGPLAGAVAGWAMLCAYCLAGVAVVLAMDLFLAALVKALGGNPDVLPTWLVTIVIGAAAMLAAYRDIRLSSRIGLVLEGVSVIIIIAVIAILVGRHGTLIDAAQSPGRIQFGPVMSSLTFAVFSFVGFESAATLAKETRDPQRAVPIAVLLSTAVVGIFFTAMTYLMVAAAGDDTAMLGNSASPFADLAAGAGVPWAAIVIYLSALISGFACVLACINALSRTFFSLGRFGLLHSSLGQVHPRHRTPHRAVVASGVLVGGIALAMAPLGLLEAFGYSGTLSTFGFLVIYLLIGIASPIDLHRVGLMRPWHVLVGAVGAALMAFTIFGSLIPVPAFPFNILPYLFAVYMLAGAAWFAAAQHRTPVQMDRDMEEA